MTQQTLMPMKDITKVPNRLELVPTLRDVTHS